MEEDAEADVSVVDNEEDAEEVDDAEQDEVGQPVQSGGGVARRGTAKDCGTVRGELEPDEEADLEMGKNEDEEEAAEEARAEDAGGANVEGLRILPS